MGNSNEGLQTGNVHEGSNMTQTPDMVVQTVGSDMISSDKLVKYALRHQVCMWQLLAQDT